MQLLQQQDGFVDDRLTRAALEKAVQAGPDLISAAIESRRSGI